MIRGPEATLATAYALLDSTQWLSPSEIEAQQGRQLEAVVAYAARFSPQFSRRLNAAGVLPSEFNSKASLRRLPELSRRDLQNAGDSFYCTEVPEDHRPIGITQTSGSTGEPVTVRRTFINQLLWLASTLREHAWHSNDFTGRLSAIRANIPDYVESADWGPPASHLHATGKSQAIPIIWDIGRQFETLQRFGPNILVIYPNTLSALCDYVEQNARTLPELGMIKTVGETLPRALRTRAAELFRARVVDSYSSQELGVLAVQCPLSELYHVCAETHLVEILDTAGVPCKAGEIGRVVVTDLHNFASPLIRYAIGDYAEVAGTPCRCGRGLPSLARILGRERNLVLMPDGTRHWPLTGFARFLEIAPIHQYQFIQHTRTAIEVRLVLSTELSGTQETALTALIQSALGYPFELRYTFFPEWLPAPNGEFEEFVCKVKDLTS